MSDQARLNELTILLTSGFHSVCKQNRVGTRIGRYLLHTCPQATFLSGQEGLETTVFGGLNLENV